MSVQLISISDCNCGQNRQKLLATLILGMNDLKREVNELKVVVKKLRSQKSPLEMLQSKGKDSKEAKKYLVRFMKGMSITA